MLGLVLALTVIATQTPRESVTVAQVHADYHEAFVIVVREPTPGDTIFGPLVPLRVSSQGPMAPLVNRAGLLLTYLLEHGTDFRLDDLLPGPKTQARLQQSFDSALSQDGRFNRLLLPLVAASLAEQGEVLVGQPAVAAKAPITVDSAAVIAARFFYPDSFAPDGQLRSRICAGVNGLPPHPSDSDLLLEAFVFDAIRTPRDEGGAFAPLQEYEDTVRATLASLPLALGSAERLRAVRNAAWTRLARSSSVRAAVLERFAALSSVLPFRLVN